jgi:hypothetical protein
MLSLVGEILPVCARKELESDAVGGDESRDEVYDLDVSDYRSEKRRDSLVAATRVS